MTLIAFVHGAGVAPASADDGSRVALATPSAEPGGPASSGTTSSGAGTNDAVTGRPVVAVASSLRAAWPALEAAWHASLPAVGTRPTFGASRTLARQIARGAPFELLLAADERSLDAIPDTRIAAGTRARYARGRLVLVTRDPAAGRPTASSSAARLPRPSAARSRAPSSDDALARLVERLAAEPALRLAIPHPEHAPYGTAAREALASATSWPLAPGRLIVGENAAQTLQFLLAGAVDAALVPGALVADGAPPGTRVRIVDPARHAPLVHALVLVDGASDAARALASWFASPAARDALAAAGFDAPP